MSYKGLFFVIPVLLLTAFLSHAQQMGLAPLTQYSVGDTRSGVQLRTTTVTQQDTLKIPFIEDFTGYGLPIDSISVDTLQTATDLVYRVTHLKLHGLKDKDSIRVYNISTSNIPVSDLLTGKKFVKVINKYTFQLFNDHNLQTPATVAAERIHYFNWLRLGKQGYSTMPDTLVFLDNQGGVFINNDMAVNMVNNGVATFDGVNYKGIPYSTTTTKGYADNLTSLPFNLSGYTINDSIYMSFYWQSRSLGESPQSNEFLYLEFLNASGTWVKVWTQKGGTQTKDTFDFAIIPITNSSYLHKGFRYRFRSYGVLNGRFAVWNVDYIYINKNRLTANEPKLKDVSIITTNRSALKNYTSVPYKHIKDLPVATITSETAQAFMKIRDSLNIYPIDLLHAFAIKRQYLVRDNRGNDKIKYNIDPFFASNNVFTQTFTDTIVGNLMDSAYVLKEEFSFQPLDTLGAIDMTFNNFTSIETYFHDSYAYDDNTPEWAFVSANAGGTKIANGYKILKADQLTHIDFCFIRNNGPNLTNFALTMSVWELDTAAHTAAPPLCEQQIAIQYSTDINGFVRYELTTPLPLDSGKTYYFGYYQKFSDALFLGFDKNNDHLDQVYFCNSNDVWDNFKVISPVPGSLMIRPVFSDNEIITGTSDPLAQHNQFTFYPNPAKSQLHFTGEPEYIAIYDLSGLLLLEKKIEGTEPISIDALQNGLYVIILSKDNYKEAKRLIIQK
ncbi:T9SS type A sorting domain-containing protein [Cytophaga aurantiaca]|uniref:T9SS type A sorting domain-containing protein n=1 Tax=Cytophaga aurantiaca TaxID=29530 RepID=UPI00035CF0F0|nr:T9SS type A sorting domain-containing protein [Cytophaga aurantiaca]